MAHQVPGGKGCAALSLGMCIELEPSELNSRAAEAQAFLCHGNPRSGNTEYCNYGCVLVFRSLDASSVPFSHHVQPASSGGCPNHDSQVELFNEPTFRAPGLLVHRSFDSGSANLTHPCWKKHSSFGGSLPFLARLQL